MKVTLRDVKAGYAAIKKLAISEFEKGNYQKSLDYIDNAATLASQIMWRYADDELEELLRKIGTKLIKYEATFISSDKKIVYYDYFGSPVILTLQYLRALVQLNYEILYLYEERSNAQALIIEIIKDIKNIRIQKIALNSNRAERLNDIYKSIVDFKPSKLFIHINTLSISIPVFYCLPTEIVKYYINLGDHAFWLGSKAIDYSFEFRSFGANVSYKKRGLSKKQLLLLPYYPIVDKQDFQGFPKECKNKVVIFSGGDFYKTVDEQKTYWNLAADILRTNPKAVIIYANKALNSEGKKFLDAFISNNNLENKFIPIGFRKDVNEVLKHCDIYMGTCPMSGGLMSQYAATNAKPILQYYPENLFAFEETESMICFNDKLKISFTDKKDFLDEAEKLIANEDYRIRKGKELQKCMINEDEFNSLFKKSLDTHQTQIEIENISINFDDIEQWWLEVNNEGYYDAGSYTYSILGIKNYLLAPGFVLKSLIHNLFKINKKPI